MNKEKIIFISKIIIPLVIAILSFTLVSKYAESKEIHEKTISTLQTKQDTVLKLSAASATIAAGASLLLGERANAVSNKLLDLTGYFIIILCAVMLEKYLVTILGLASFKIIIPVACILFSLFTIIDKEAMRKLSLKLFAFALVAFLIIPISVGISNVIEKTYAEANVESILDETEKLNDELNKISENTENNVIHKDTTTQNNIDEIPENAVSENNNMTNEENVKLDPLSIIGNFVNNTKNKVVDSATNAKDKVMSAVGNVVSIVTEKGKELIEKLTRNLNKMIEAIAVMLVTTCVIPIAIIIFFIFIVKMIFSVDFNVDTKKIPKLSDMKNFIKTK